MEEDIETTSHGNGENALCCFVSGTGCGFGYGRFCICVFGSLLHSVESRRAVLRSLIQFLEGNELLLTMIGTYRVRSVAIESDDGALCLVAGSASSLHPAGRREGKTKAPETWKLLFNPHSLCYRSFTGSYPILRTLSNATRAMCDVPCAMNVLTYVI